MEYRLYERVEVLLEGPSEGNPFLDVSFGAEFTRGARTVTVRGFYDGGGRYIVRFMPDAAGKWTYRTQSSDSVLDGVMGSFTVTDAAEGCHGPVCANGTRFEYADGSAYSPVGTTSYAWIHQPEDLRDRTIETLAESPFTKLRMCIFPKSYTYNTNEPDSFVFPGSLAEGFDLQRFDPEYFRLLEHEISRLAALGVEADLILFHPYDRWGFQDLPAEVEDRYLRYIVARLSSFHNVWWSMANEWDFMEAKSAADFHRFFRIVAEEDPYGHLRSVHNGRIFYDHHRSWVTHVSVQRSSTEQTVDWVEEYRKPVIIDECGYEGNLAEGWGSISARELVYRQWEAIRCGGFPGAHGETIYNDRHEFWWSKGGSLTGESPARISFMRHILEEAPAGRLRPTRQRWAAPYLSAGDEYRLYYFGRKRHSWQTFELPTDRKYRIDVIDTWNMTISPVEGTHSGTTTVVLPGIEYIAVRITQV